MVDEVESDEGSDDAAEAGEEGVDGHVFGDGMLGGEFGDPKAPGDIAAGIGDAEEGHADGPGPVALEVVEDEDGSGEEDIEAGANDEEVDAVVEEAPGVGKEDAEDDGDDADDPGDVFFGEVDAVAGVGEVFDEEGGGDEIADAHHHPRHEEGAEVAVEFDPAEGGPEGAGGGGRGLPDGSREAVGEEAGGDGAEGEEEEDPAVVLEVASEQPAAEEAEGHGGGGAGGAGDGEEAAAGVFGVVGAIELGEQGDLHGHAEETDAEASDEEPVGGRESGGEGHEAPAGELDFGGSVGDGALGAKQKGDNKEAHHEATAGGSDEHGFGKRFHVEHADGDEHAEGGDQGVEDANREGAPQFVAEGAAGGFLGGHEVARAHATGRAGEQLWALLRRGADLLAEVEHQEGGFESRGG